MDLMQELNRAVEQLFGRLNGPFQARLYLQPLMATFLAVRAGLKDARFGRPPFLRTLILSRDHRRRLVRSGWIDIRRVFFLALIIDAIYQGVMFRTIYPLQSFITATVLAILPYLLLRGIATRIARRAIRTHPAEAARP